MSGSDGSRAVHGSSMDAPGASHATVWLFVDFRVFESASGLRGAELHRVYARWWQVAEGRGGIWGMNVRGSWRPSIAFELPDVSRWHLPETGLADRHGTSSSSRGSEGVWLYLDFALFRRASGLRGRVLHGSWCRLWCAAEARGHVRGDRRPYIALEVVELRDAP